MIEWILVISMSNTSQKIGMVDSKSCIEAMSTIHKVNDTGWKSRDSLQRLTEGAFCINVATGEIRRRDDEVWE